jgi:hypothetical protein
MQPLWCQPVPLCSHQHGFLLGFFLQAWIGTLCLQCEAEELGLSGRKWEQMKRGRQKHPGTTPAPQKGKGWHEKSDRWGEGTQGRGKAPASSASHPLWEGPGLLSSALALLLKFQLCAQPSWLHASHVPAPGRAAGSGARGRHMDKKPGSAEQRGGCPLGPGTQAQYQSSPALPSPWHGSHRP